eukprot:6185026-Pleurochrysis_carterae.AAC.3
MEDGAAAYAGSEAAVVLGAEGSDTVTSIHIDFASSATGDETFCCEPIKKRHQTNDGHEQLAKSPHERLCSSCRGVVEGI